MITTYYGSRGSGKTVKLLKEAAKAAIDDNIVIVVTFSPDYISTLKEKSVELVGEEFTEKIIFTSYENVSNYIVGEDKEKIKVFVDEAEYVLYDMLFKGFGNRVIDIKLTIDTTDGVELKRSNWDKNYVEDN